MQLGTVKLESGEWEWQVGAFFETRNDERTEYQMLIFTRPQDDESVMRVPLPPDWEVKNDEHLSEIAKHVKMRELRDDEGVRWFLSRHERPEIAMGVEKDLGHLPEQILIRAKGEGSWVTDLPEGRNLCDLTDAELIQLIRRSHPNRSR